jgi:hypothetical protein
VNLPTDCAGAKRDDLSVVVRTVRGGEVSDRAKALVERVEALVPVGFGLALDAICCRDTVLYDSVPVRLKGNAVGTRVARASHVIAIRTRSRARRRLSRRVFEPSATRVPRSTKPR